VPCPHCAATAKTEQPRRTALGYRTFRCHACHRTFNERMGTLFNHLQHPTDVVLLGVLWRLRYKFSLRDLAEMFLERGFVFTHETVREWEARFAPLLTARLRAKRRGQGGTKWHADETYIRAYRVCRKTVSTVKQSQATSTSQWRRMTSRHDGARRRCEAGGTRCRRRAARTAEALTACPSVASSPWMRRCPQRGCSQARRRMRASISAGMGGRPPGLPRRYVHLRRTSSRCHMRIVSGLHRSTQWSSRRRGPAAKRARAAAKAARVSCSARVSRGGRGAGAAGGAPAAAAGRSPAPDRDCSAARRSPERCRTPRDA
jgi:transposase-like protein